MVSETALFSSCASFLSSDLLLLGLQWLFFCSSGLHRRLKAMDAERYKPRPIFFSALPPSYGLQWLAFHSAYIVGVKAMDAEQYKPRLILVHPQCMTTMIQPTAVGRKINRLRSVNPIHARKREALLHNPIKRQSPA